MRPIVAVPATLLLIYRAWSRNSLTALGIFAATGTAIAHAIHPWSVFYALLAAFFLAGTAVTKVKHNYKTTLTLTSSGGTPSPTAPSPRTAIQVLANSAPASFFILTHAAYLAYASSAQSTCLAFPTSSSPTNAFLPYAILAQYAAVAADTFSSELGILSGSAPVLITTFRRVPRGTNGGITPLGLGAGLLGAALMALVGLGLMPLCGTWTQWDKFLLGAAMTAWGTLGSVLDSLLGALLQASVVDRRAGKVVESEGGGKVLYTSEAKGEKSAGRTLVSGRDLLSNNGVNFVMALSMSLGALLFVRLAVT